MASPPDAATREAMRRYWERQRGLHDFNGHHPPHIVVAPPTGQAPDPLDDYFQAMNGAAPPPLVPPAAAPLYQPPPASPQFSQPPPAYSQPPPVHHVAPAAGPPNFWYNAGRAAGQLGQDVQTPPEKGRRTNRRAFLGAAAAAGLGAGLLYLWNRSRVPGGTAGPKEGETGGSTGGGQTSGAQTQQQGNPQTQNYAQKLFDGDVYYVTWAGSRIVFFGRTVSKTGNASYDIQSMKPDGSDATVLANIPLHQGESLNWYGSPDSTLFSPGHIYYVYSRLVDGIRSPALFRAHVKNGEPYKLVDFNDIRNKRHVDYLHVGGISRDGERVLTYRKSEDDNDESGVKVGIIKAGSTEITDIYKTTAVDPDLKFDAVLAPNEKIAFTRVPEGSSTRELWIMEHDGSDPRKVDSGSVSLFYSGWTMDDPTNEWTPSKVYPEPSVWNPKGSEFAYLKKGSTGNNLWTVKVLSGEKTQLTFHGHVKTFKGWSPDSRYLLYTLDDESRDPNALMERSTKNTGTFLPEFGLTGVGWSDHPLDDRLRIAFGSQGGRTYIIPAGQDPESRSYSTRGLWTYAL